MQIHEILINRKNEALAQIDALRQEISEIDRMLANASVPAGAANGSTFQATVSPAMVPVMPRAHMTKDDAIIEAVKAGNNTPALISEFIRTKLGVPVNPATTRTRLSRMKADGKIKHDGIGWTL
jgi:hypothetical protein